MADQAAPSAPSAADLLQLSGGLADDGTPVPVLDDFGRPMPTADGAGGGFALDPAVGLRLRQLLTGVFSGASGGYTGAGPMSPAGMITSLLAPYLGVKPPLPSADTLVKGSLDTVGLPPEPPGKRDLAGNLLVNVGAAAGMPLLGAGLSRTLPELAPTLLGASSGVGAGGAQTLAEKYFPDSPVAQAVAPIVGGFLGAPPLGRGPTAVGDAADRQGVTGALTTGDATQSPFAQILENVMRMMPGGATASTQKAKTGLNLNPAQGPPGILPKRVDEVGDMSGAPVPDADNLNVHIADAVDAANQRYLDNLQAAKTHAESVLGNGRADITPVQDFASTYGARAAQSGLVMNPDTFTSALGEAGKINKQADKSNTVSLAGLLDKRTALGQMAFSSNPQTEFQVPSTGQPGLQELYGAVGDTLKQGAEAAAGPAGRQAIQNVDDLVTGFRSPGPGQPATATTPAKALADYSKEGSNVGRLTTDLQGGDLTRLAALKSQLTPDEWNGLAGSVWKGLWEPSAANKDLVSPQQALTNWNKITPAAKDMLWGTSSPPGGGSVPQTPTWRDAMDDLATVAGGMANTARFGNPSGTARVGGGAAALMLGLNQLMSGNYKGAATTAGVAGGSYYAQKLLQSPQVVRALTNQAVGGVDYWPTTAQRLQAISAANPDLKDAIDAFSSQAAPIMGR